MNPYKFHERELNPSWSILQMKELLKIAIDQNSSTLISYATLEGRIILERIEFEIITMSAHCSEDSQEQDVIDKNNGIQKVSSKYKALRYRYQSFSEAFSRVMLDEYSFKYFDFKSAENLQSRLSQYLHLQTRKPNDFSFESDFIQTGINLINETITFIEKLYNAYEGKFIFGTFDIDTLKNGFEVEFENWLKAVDNDVDALTNRLKKIVEDHI